MTPELDTEEGLLAGQVAQAGSDPVIRLPTNYEAVYRQAVEQLGRNLKADDAGAAREAVRVLIERVVVHAGDGRGGEVAKCAPSTSMATCSGRSTSSSAPSTAIHKHNNPATRVTGLLC